MYDVTLIAANSLGYDTLVLTDYINCIAPPKIVVDDTQKFVCPGDSIHFMAAGADSIVWFKHNTKTNVYGPVLGDKPVQTTMYSVIGINSYGCKDSTSVRAVYVPLPPSVFVAVSGKTIEAQHNPGAFSYSWFLNDTDISIHTQIIEPKKTGNYKVIISDSAGCTSVSTQVYFEYTAPIGIAGIDADKIDIYPNPASGSLYISGLLENQPAKITITDMIGRRVMETELINNTVDITALVPALYFISIHQNNNTVSKKIRVE